MLLEKRSIGAPCLNTPGGQAGPYWPMYLLAVQIVQVVSRMIRNFLQRFCANQRSATLRPFKVEPTSHTDPDQFHQRRLFG